MLFAGLPVADFPAASAWYERVFGRPADVVAHDEEVLWQVTTGGWLYIVRDPARAGTGSAAMAVPDLEVALAELAARDVTAGPVEPQGSAGRKAVARDPDGNALALIEVNGPS